MQRKPPGPVIVVVAATVDDIAVVERAPVSQNLGVPSTSEAVAVQVEH